MKQPLWIMVIVVAMAAGGEIGREVIEHVRPRRVRLREGFQRYWPETRTRPLALALVGALALLLGLAACTSIKIGGIGGTRVEGPRLSFPERAHDFGKITSSQKTEHRVAFTNTGNRPLEIRAIWSETESAMPGGCT
ncbi:MAG: DUF1573 domain-containing protein [Chloroflexi bacterium]|nr:DUF1573 domain-containing protein [Chloroflexota bacterium]